MVSVGRGLSDVRDHDSEDVERDKGDPLFADVKRAVPGLTFVRRSRVWMREHGRYVYAEIFVEPEEGAPPATEMTRHIREAVMPLDWRLQHAAANVLPRGEQDIEDGGSGR